MNRARQSFPLVLVFPEIAMSHVSTLTLHQLRYDELSEAEAASVRQHIAACPRCSARLQAIDNQRAAFVLEPIPDAIRQQAARQKRRSWLTSLLRRPQTIGLAAVAALTLAVLPVIGVGGADQPTTRSKGAAMPEVLVEGMGVLGEGQPIRTGDRLQLRVPPGDWEQVWIGDRGTLLADFPMQPSRSWELVPISLEVDDEGSVEHIVVVLSNHPLSASEAAGAVDGDALGGVVVQELILPKEP